MKYLLILLFSFHIKSFGKNSIELSTFQKNELSKSYSEFEIKASCQYKKPTSLDVVALLNKVSGEGVFVFIESVKPYKITEFDRFKFKNNKAEVEVQCHSYAEAKKLNQVLKDSAEAGLSGEIELHDQDAAVCIGSASPTEFKCFRWDSKKSKVLKAGGWIT